MERLADRLCEWVDQVVVLDCVSPYVVIGTLVRATADYVELKECDVHDLRDTKTTRELYLVKAARHGVQPNREAVVCRLAEVTTVSLLADVQTG